MPLATIVFLVRADEDRPFLTVPLRNVVFEFADVLVKID